MQSGKSSTGEPVNPPPPSALAASGPPHGIDLFTYAAVSADIAEGDRPVADILRDRQLNDAQWTEASLFWARRMGEDAKSGEARVALAFSDAFARAQDGKRPLPPLDVEGWATLVHDIDVAGALGPVLVARGLSRADHSRLVRHWAKAIATQPEIAARHASRLASLADAVGPA